MNLRKPNKNIPLINNQEDDKVVVDGFLSPAEIVERGRLSAKSTIEQMKMLYPHSEEAQVREREMMVDEALNKELKALEIENKEKISAFYAKHKIKDKIKSIKNELSNLNSEFEKTKHISLIEEKNRKIKELEDLITEAKKQIQ